MKKTFLIVMFLTLLQSVVVTAFTWGEVSRDTRILQYSPEIPFTKMLPDEDWRVAKITRGEGSPASRVIGWYFDNGLNKIVEPDGSRSGHFWFGSIATLQNITPGKSPFPDTYEWEVFPAFSVSRKANAKEEDKSYAPFRTGGTAIIRYQKIEGIRTYDLERAISIDSIKDDYTLGGKQFDPVYAIPEEWTPFALSAFKFQQANKSLFDDKNVVKNQKRLLELTSDSNPFNAVAAARVLAPARGLDAKFVKEHIAQSTGYQQAIFTYLAFKNAHLLQHEGIDTALRQIVNNATSSTTLKWIILGVTTTQNDDANSYFALKDRVKTILLRVDKKQKELKTKTLDDEYVDELLISAQVRERPVTLIGKTSNF